MIQSTMVGGVGGVKKKDAARSFFFGHDCPQSGCNNNIFRETGLRTVVSKKKIVPRRFLTGSWVAVRASTTVVDNLPPLCELYRHSIFLHSLEAFFEACRLTERIIESLCEFFRAKFDR